VFKKVTVSKVRDFYRLCIVSREGSFYMVYVNRRLGKFYTLVVVSLHQNACSGFRISE